MCFRQSGCRERFAYRKTQVKAVRLVRRLASQPNLERMGAIHAVMEVVVWLTLRSILKRKLGDRRKRSQDDS